MFFSLYLRLLSANSTLGVDKIDLGDPCEKDQLSENQKDVSVCLNVRTLMRERASMREILCVHSRLSVYLRVSVRVSESICVAV